MLHFGGLPVFEPKMNLWVGTRVPDEHTLMLSFAEEYTTGPANWCFINAYLYIGGLSETHLEAGLCGFRPPVQPAVYRTDEFHVQVKTDRKRAHVELKAGFNVLVSFHESSQPQRLQNGKWNCSVPYLSDFRQHFPYNLVAQCFNGRDEASCFYKTAECGEGLFSAGGSCFAYKVPGKGISWNAASNECLSLGCELASLNAVDEWSEVVDLITRQTFNAPFIGMKTPSVTAEDVPYRVELAGRHSGPLQAMQIH